MRRVHESLPFMEKELAGVRVMEGSHSGNENLSQLPSRGSARINDVCFMRHSHALRQVEYEATQMAS